MGQCILKSEAQTLAWYKEQIAQMDSAILELKLSQPALRALVNLKVNCVSDLKKLDNQTLLNSHGIGPRAYRKLETLR